MKDFLITLTLLFFILSCQQTKNDNGDATKNYCQKILVPTQIYWDTIPDGFGEGIDLLHKEFEILFFTDSSIVKINTSSEIDNDSILIVNFTSLPTIYKIISKSGNDILFANENRIDTIYSIQEKNNLQFNKQEFRAETKISNESYLRLKKVLNSNKISPPSEVIIPK